MPGEEDVRHLSQHGIRQVLNHEAHAVSFGPAGAQQRARLRFAGFQRYSGPPQFAPKFHQFRRYRGFTWAILLLRSARRALRAARSVMMPVVDYAG